MSAHLVFVVTFCNLHPVGSVDVSVHLVFVVTFCNLHPFGSVDVSVHLVSVVTGVSDLLYWYCFLLCLSCGVLDRFGFSTVTVLVLFAGGTHDGLLH